MERPLFLYLRTASIPHRARAGLEHFDSGKGPLNRTERMAMPSAGGWRTRDRRFFLVQGQPYSVSGIFL
ncbi:MAG: hypothetical protein A4E70_01116 [Syntrophus sp. PtaU1.Bin005]|jgi:hypothetical protein|nr:MAG: hypothetical protein A4E69_01495 [Syntrophus sp. PtaB.Bin138]OPY81682.1 MAG: hypothetical protein A4E70_01116 [Syntrophus sp. PtaU1.Bin005]